MSSQRCPNILHVWSSPFLLSLCLCFSPCPFLISVYIHVLTVSSSVHAPLTCHVHLQSWFCAKTQALLQIGPSGPLHFLWGYVTVYTYDLWLKTLVGKGNDTSCAVFKPAIFTVSDFVISQLILEKNCKQISLYIPCLKLTVPPQILVIN